MSVIVTHTRRRQPRQRGCVRWPRRAQRPAAAPQADSPLGPRTGLPARSVWRSFATRLGALSTRTAAGLRAGVWRGGGRQSTGGRMADEGQLITAPDEDRGHAVASEGQCGSRGRCASPPLPLPGGTAAGGRTLVVRGGGTLVVRREGHTLVVRRTRCEVGEEEVGISGPPRSAWSKGGRLLLLLALLPAG